MAETFALNPQTSHRLNTFRGDRGGFLLGSGLMMVMGLGRNHTPWFLAVALIISALVFGRLVGFVFDGIDMTVVPAFVVELVVIGVMVLAY
jgi:hypothetical protein